MNSAVPGPPAAGRHHGPRDIEAGSTRWSPPASSPASSPTHLCD